MIRISITGADKCISELGKIEKRVDDEIGNGIKETAMLGQETGKQFLAGHMFTMNAYVSWQQKSTGKHSAIISYFDAGIPHPTGLRTSAYFLALEYGRRGYKGSPNKMASGTGGDYTFPHWHVNPAGGAFIVTTTYATIMPIFPKIMSEAVGRAL